MVKNLEFEHITHCLEDMSNAHEQNFAVRLLQPRPYKIGAVILSTTKSVM
jgi:hypothetical protein